MRVITGSARGHPLKVPKSASTRPTPAQAKEAMFSSLGDRVIGARVLDLFAGSGAFGIEALSRGAKSAVFVELDGLACATLRDNLHSTHLEENAVMMDMEVERALEALAAAGESFDIIFADPPYDKLGTRNEERGTQKSESKARGPRDKKPINWKAMLLNSDHLRSVLAPDGLLLLEYYKQDPGLESPHFKPQKDFRFGDTMITLFRHV